MHLCMSFCGVEQTGWNVCLIWAAMAVGNARAAKWLGSLSYTGTFFLHFPSKWIFLKNTYG